MKDSLLKDLNSVQKKAVINSSGPSLILAGAGSGKTRVLTYKAAYLLSTKAAKEDDLVLITFTNKAAWEMQQRIQKLTAREKMSPKIGYVGTFHSLAAKILRKEYYAADLAANFVIFDESDSLAVIKEAMKKLALDPREISPAVILRIISQAKNELILPSEYQSLVRGKWQDMASLIYPKYQAILKESHALDFDDLLLELFYLWQNNRQILDRYQEKFKFIFVDEFQDTNHAQYEIVKILAKKYQNISAVGDFSQSIYSFRGANFQNLQQFKIDFPDTKVFNLEENYRSTQNILQAANQVIANNTSHPTLTLFTKNRQGEKITFFSAENEISEAYYIVNKLQTTLLTSAVLYRTNSIYIIIV